MSQRKRKNTRKSRRKGRPAGPGPKRAPAPREKPQAGEPADDDAAGVELSKADAADEPRGPDLSPAAADDEPRGPDLSPAAADDDPRAADESAAAIDGDPDDAPSDDADAVPERAPRRRSRRVSTEPDDLPLERERRFGWLAGAVGMAGIAATFVAIAYSTKASGEGPQPASFDGDIGNDADRRERLVDYAANESDQAISAILHVGGLLASVAIGIYFFWLVRNRNPAVPQYILWLSLVAPVLFATAAGLGFLALADAADTFVGLDREAQTNDRAKDVLESSSLYTVAFVLDIVGRLAFGAWLWLLSRAAMRVDLLSVFLGIWGVGTGITVPLGAVGVTIGEAMYIGWLASVAILALGYWPGGRPDGWTHRLRPAEAL